MVDKLKSGSLSYQTPIEGIKRAENSIAPRAERISKFDQSADNSSVVEDLVGLKTDIYAVKANTAVIKSISELEDSILDIVA
jgi:hypothetical protein